MKKVIIVGYRYFGQKGNKQLIIMVIKDERVITPHGNTVIWRYFSLEKFIDLIMTSEIFFSNASKMSDQYEGKIPKKNEKKIYNYFIEKGFKKEDARIESDVLLHSINSLRHLTLLNCWSINQNESYALWKIYLNNAKSGVAIKSTVSKLKKALNQSKENYDEDIYISKIEYSDYINNDPYNRFKIMATKNKFYQYENELRLMIFNYPLSEGGIKTPYDISVGRRYKVDLNELIHQIYLSPFAGEWASNSIKNMIIKMKPDLMKKINYSEILDN